MKVIIMVFYLGSSKMVTSRAMVPRGEMESSVNPVRVDVVKLRSMVVNGLCRMLARKLSSNPLRDNQKIKSKPTQVECTTSKPSPEELWEMFDTLKRQRCHIGPFMLGRQLLVPLDRSRHRRPPTLGDESVLGSRQVGLMRPGALCSDVGFVGHVGGTAVRGCDDLAARSAFIISFFPSREDLLEAPDKGAEDEVLCLTAVVDPTEQELGDCTVARVDPTEHELGNCDVARVDPTEQELGNCNVARVDPTEHELGNSNVARVDPTEHELGNWDIARVDPTEQEFGNCNVARVDPTEHELGNSNVARVDLTKHELRNCDVALLPRVKSGANPEIWP
ncbi:hypothetical protein GW17_00053428 [Ensete ventricosum]|nr:hypothetical protein GW17_00053428 [Ensete ventricosum]